MSHEVTMSDDIERPKVPQAFLCYVNEVSGSSVNFTIVRTNNDIATTLVNYRASYSKCWDVLVVKMKGKKLNLEAIRKVIADDYQEIVAILNTLMGDKTLYKSFIASAHKHSQSILDLIDEILQTPSDISIPRGKLTNALLKLSDVSGLHPKCLDLPPVARLGKSAISGGSFADVWRGKIGETFVALKIVRVFEDSDKTAMIKQFLREALLWNQFRHPNVLPFLGLFYLEGRVCFTSPWMENGHLDKFLKANPKTNKMTLLHDISHGVEFLHENKVVHGDLKGDNVLITAEGRACLADFGLSRVIETQAHKWSSLRSATLGGGTVRWLAPELFKEGCKSTFASDVYALGCIFYEVWAGQLPFSDCPNDAAVMFRVLGGNLPTRPLGIADKIWQFMVLCWSPLIDSRPSVNSIIEFIHSEGSKDCPAPEWTQIANGHLGNFVRKYPLMASKDDIARILGLKKKIPRGKSPEQAPHPLPRESESQTLSVKVPNAPRLSPIELVPEHHLTQGDQLEPKFSSRTHLFTHHALEPFDLNVNSSYTNIEINPILKPDSQIRNASGDILPETGSASNDSVPHIHWFMLFPADTAYRSDGALNEIWTKEPATYPRVTSLLLVFPRFHPFSWNFHVSARDRFIGVTCGDVLNSIWSHLFLLVDAKDFANASELVQRQLSITYETNRSAGANKARLGDGMRRLDWLGSSVYFGGLLQDAKRVKEVCGADVSFVFVLRSSQLPMGERGNKGVTWVDEQKMRQHDGRRRSNSLVSNCATRYGHHRTITGPSPHLNMIT